MSENTGVITDIREFKVGNLHVELSKLAKPGKLIHYLAKVSREVDSGIAGAKPSLEKVGVYRIGMQSPVVALPGRKMDRETEQYVNDPEFPALLLQKVVRRSIEVAIEKELAIQVNCANDLAGPATAATAKE